MLGKVLFVTLHERRHVCVNNIDLPANFLRVADIETPDAKIAVNTCGYTQEQLLIWLPGDCHDFTLISGETTDETAGRSFILWRLTARLIAKAAYYRTLLTLMPD
jgi:hypothetical protein